MRVNIRYFAMMREIAKKSEEVIEGSFQTPCELYLHLRNIYDFPLDMEHIKVSINGEYQDQEVSLKEGDLVVFIPPVAGG